MYKVLVERIVGITIEIEEWHAIRVLFKTLWTGIFLSREGANYYINEKLGKFKSKASAFI